MHQPLKQWLFSISSVPLFTVRHTVGFTSLSSLLERSRRFKNWRKRRISISCCSVCSGSPRRSSNTGFCGRSSIAGVFSPFRRTRVTKHNISGTTHCLGARDPSRNVAPLPSRHVEITKRRSCLQVWLFVVYASPNTSVARQTVSKPAIHRATPRRCPSRHVGITK